MKRLLFAVAVCMSVHLGSAARMPIGTNVSSMDDWSIEQETWQATDVLQVRAVA